MRHTPRRLEEEVSLSQHTLLLSAVYYTYTKQPQLHHKLSNPLLNNINNSIKQPRLLVQKKSFGVRRSVLVLEISTPSMVVDKKYQKHFGQRQSSFGAPPQHPSTNQPHLRCARISLASISPLPPKCPQKWKERKKKKNATLNFFAVPNHQTQ